MGLRNKYRFVLGKIQNRRKLLGAALLRHTHMHTNVAPMWPILSSELMLLPPQAATHLYSRYGLLLIFYWSKYIVSDRKITLFKECAKLRAYIYSSLIVTS